MIKWFSLILSLTSGTDNIFLVTWKRSKSLHGLTIVFPFLWLFRISIVRNGALTLNLLSAHKIGVFQQDWRHPASETSARSDLKLYLNFLSYIDPQRSAADGNATDSNLPFSPLQRHLSNSKIQGEHLSWYIVCLKEKHNKQDNWQRFTFSAELKPVYSISWCLELQQSWFIILLHKKRQVSTDLWFRNIWSKDMKKFATSVHSKSISHNGTWQPIT